MGLFAFRRRQQLEAASQEVASSVADMPTPKLEPAPADTSNADSHKRNRRVSKRQQLPDAG